MAIWRGSFWQAIFRLEDQNAVPIPVTGWTFHAMFREEPESQEILLDLTTANGGFAVVDGLAGRFSMQIASELSEGLPDGVTIDFDVFRTDVIPGPIFLFCGRVPVKTPVTRDFETEPPPP